MTAKGTKPNTSIRIDPDVLYKACIAAVAQKKTLGQWLEEGILQKIEREGGKERLGLEKGMSLRKVAKELGISPVYLSYMVNGKRPWRGDLHERYCQLVNTPVNTLNLNVNRPLKLQPWREREGVEPTVDAEGSPPNGFEAREAHRDPSAPLYA